LQNRKGQQELIVKLLEKKGLKGLFTLLRSSPRKSIFLISVVIAKLAMKLIQMLCYKSERAQTLICESFGFTPVDGVIVLNPLPKKMIQQILSDPGLWLKVKSA
jgi:hypothetical protein